MINEQTLDYIDVNKGFRRTTKQPFLADEIFTTYTEAVQYAKDGAYGGTAYIGQTIKVVPDENSYDDMKEYLIGKDYILTPITSDTISETNLSVEFNYNTESGTSAAAINLPEGFVLSSISVKIITPFDNDDAVKIVRFKNDNQDEVLKIYADSSDILTDEADSEFIFKVTDIMETKTKIFVIINQCGTGGGSGILKLN